MSDKDKTKQQLVNELENMRQRIATLETFEVQNEQVAKALNKNEANFRNSVDESPLAIVINKAYGDLTYANQAALDLFGYDNFEEMKNVSLIKRHTSQNLTLVKERWKRINQGEFTTAQDAHDVIRSDGEIRHVEAFYKLVLWDGEERLQVTFQDITERKQMEEALAKSEKFSTGLLENSPIPMIVVNPDSSLRYVNPAMEEITGYSAEELIGLKPPYPWWWENTAKESLANQREMMKTGRNKFERMWHNKNGNIFWVELNAKPVFINGELDFLLGAWVDITERKQTEELLHHSQVMASLGEMTAGIAHEVGNPLASILLYSETAINNAENVRQTKKNLRIIRDEARRAGNLLKDLLAYSRKIEPNMRKVNVHTVINKVVKLLQYRMSVKNINLTANLLKGTLNVNGNTAQLTQVFMNLIINAGEALKGTGEGNITVSSITEDGWAKIAIADDGIGIPKENLDQIFMPFFTTKDIGKGTGLGLSMVYGILTSHGGTITAENNINGGATFTVQLPIY